MQSPMVVLSQSDCYVPDWDRAGLHGGPPHHALARAQLWVDLVCGRDFRRLCRLLLGDLGAFFIGPICTTPCAITPDARRHGLKTVRHSGWRRGIWRTGRGWNAHAACFGEGIDIRAEIQEIPACGALPLYQCLDLCFRV